MCVRNGTSARETNRDSGIVGGGVRGVDDRRGGVAGAAAIAPLGPSFVRGCRGTSVFLFQRRR